MEAATKLEDLAAGQDERRQDPRLSVDEPASLFLVDQGSFLVCRIVEISLAGCRMKLGEPFAFGASLRVEAIFKLRGVAFRLAAVTVWSDGNAHLGVRFTDLTSRRMDELIEVLCEIAAESAAKAVRRAANRRAADESENASGERRIGDAAAASATIADSAGLRGRAAPSRVFPATKEPGSPAGGPKSDSHRTGIQPPAEAKLPAMRPSGNSGTAAEYGGAKAPVAKQAGQERRSDVRVRVETSAIVLLVNVGSRLRGRILNLSLGGCRIRTEERFPVGIYTRVEIEFRLEGLPFRLGGVVQAIQDRDCVGIRFLDLSERKRQQVEQLMMELAELHAEENLPIPAPAPDRGSSA